jgi:hypothetical protein
MFVSSFREFYQITTNRLILNWFSLGTEINSPYVILPVFMLWVFLAVSRCDQPRTWIFAFLAGYGLPFVLLCCSLSAGPFARTLRVNLKAKRTTLAQCRPKCRCACSAPCRPKGRRYTQRHGQAQSSIMEERYKNSEGRRDLGAR